MKLRNGFVSNSSSSSYIIKYDKDINLEDIIPREKEGYGDDTHFDSIGLKDTVKYLRFLYNEDYRSFIYFAKYCSEMCRAVDAGLQVAFITISDYDTKTRNMLKLIGAQTIYTG